MTTKTTIDEKVITLISDLKCVMRNRGLVINDAVSDAVYALVIVALTVTIEANHDN